MLQADHLGHAELVETSSVGESKLTKFTGIKDSGKTVTILVRGSNELVLDEAERSLHDALCVVRSLVKSRQMLVGGGAAEMEISLRLAEYARTLSGQEAYCFRAFASAFEVVPYTLAENAGLNPMELVTELRARHAAGDIHTGINVDKVPLVLRVPFFGAPSQSSSFFRPTSPICVKPASTSCSPCL